MEKVTDNVIDFLKNYGMDYSDIDAEKTCSLFLEEMKQGLSGEKSSLQMVPTYIEIGAKVPVNESVLVLDAGGTNFRVAVVYFDQDGKAVIENFKKYPMPGTDSEVDKETFFGMMVRYFENILVERQKVGFCFSYPVEMFPSKDGRLIQFSKQIKAKGVEGELIGESLRLTLQKLYSKSLGTVVVLNDTVATLLAGLAVSQERTNDGYIGFILGTGTNCCYLEKNINIRKAGAYAPLKSQVINIESAGFSKGLGGVLDRKYDQTTMDPGEHILEKMISGRYLGGLCHTVINAAISDGMFSTAGSEGLKRIKELTTIDVNSFLMNPRNNNSNSVAFALAEGNDADRTTILTIMERLVERAALLAALTLTATALKTDYGQTPDAPVRITAEGTTFYQLKDLKAKTEFYLKKYLTERHNRYWELVNVENATLIGAAVAGLTN